MAARILDGKFLSETMRNEIADGVRNLLSARIVPKLGVILVGEYSPSLIYVKSKETACKKVGIDEETFRLPVSTTEEGVISVVERLNRDPGYHGILVQLPLPAHISTERVLETIHSEKDVDGLTPFNLGKLIWGKPFFYPATPSGIIEILIRNGIEIQGKHVVIIGRGQLVGKPLANMLLKKDPSGNATVSICHSLSRDMEELTRKADILVAAIGRARFVRADMVKSGAVVIDVGVNRVDDKLVGDVDFDVVVEKASAITPVPGGVGPMTVTMLLSNVLTAAKRWHSKNS